MFTGIINKIGKIYNIDLSDNIIEIKCLDISISDGESISVDGICLTLQKLVDNILYFQVSEETISKTIIKDYKKDTKVNLEIPVTTESFLSGHFVLGHVDDVLTLINIDKIKKGLWNFHFTLPYGNLIVDKGSLTINGVSLTSNIVDDKSFYVSIVSETYDRTNFKYSKVGDIFNVEYDIIGKYIRKLINDI